MDIFRESRYIMQLFNTILLCWLGWLCGLAFGQDVAEAFTGSANFPDIGLTCIANVAAFIRFILRGKFWTKSISESATPQGICRGWSSLKHIRGAVSGRSTCAEELQKCSVVMLANLTFNSSERRSIFFIAKYMCHVRNVHSILLRYLPLERAAINVESCTENHEGRCGCIVYDTVEDVTMMLARRIPGTVKRLSDSLCLLPCLQCLISGCHGYNQGLLHVENDTLTEGESQVDPPAAVSELLDLKSVHKDVGICICIPVRSANDDEWTNQLITVLKADDKEFRGAVIRKGRTDASSALENYKNGNGECDAVEKYSLASLIAVPGLAQALINVVLTFWFKVDGFSSGVLSTTAMSDYNPSPTFDKLYPHWFLTKAHVKSNANNTNVYQVLFIRSGFPRWTIWDYSLWLVRWICCISWMVLVALEGGANKWYHTHSMAPSKPRIVVMLVGIWTALVMDAFDLKLALKIRRKLGFSGKHYTRCDLLICATIVLEIVCIVACSAIARVMGIKALGRWIYSALQFLVLVKWTIGVILLTQQTRQLLKSEKSGENEPTWWYGSCGLYILSSTFLLNAALAGARAKWEF